MIRTSKYQTVVVFYCWRFSPLLSVFGSRQLWRRICSHLKHEYKQGFLFSLLYPRAMPPCQKRIKKNLLWNPSMICETLPLLHVPATLHHIKLDLTFWLFGLTSVRQQTWGRMSFFSHIFHKLLWHWSKCVNFTPVALVSCLLQGTHGKYFVQYSSILLTCDTQIFWDHLDTLFYCICENYK